MMHPVVRTLMHVLTTWFLFRFLTSSSFGWWIAVLVTAGAAFTAVYVSVHVHRPRLAEAWATVPGLRHLIRGACAISRLQAPVEPAEGSAGLVGAAPNRRAGTGRPEGRSTSRPDAPGTSRAGDPGAPARGQERSGSTATREHAHSPRASKSPFALEHESHFERAAADLRETVVGHDATVDAVMHHLARSVALRQASESPDSIPLGRFLLVGPSGFGRRYLARAVGRCLFDSGDLVTVDVAAHPTPELAADAAWGIGTGGEPGTLVSAVKSRPTRVIVIEHVERLEPRALDQLTGILDTGRLEDPVSGTTIDFRSCVFFLLAEGISDALESMPSDPEARSEWSAQAIDDLASQTALTRPLLQTLDGVFPCLPLALLEQAEVVAQLIDRECARFGLRLAYVEPAFIVEQLRGVDAAYGLATLPARVKAALKEPIYQATQRGATQLTLDHNTVPALLEAEAEPQECMS